MYVLSDVYKMGCFVTQYEYGGLFDSNYKKELSWGKKIFCFEEYANDSMMQVLRNIEEPEERKVLQVHWGKRVTEKCTISGGQFVIKQAELTGFFHNLILMGLGVNVWNNVQWAQEEKIPVLKPVAVVEERLWNKTKTRIVYLYEGTSCE